MLFPNEKIELKLPNAELVYFPSFLPSTKAQELFYDLKKNVPWQQDSITIYNKKQLQPRLTALYGNQGKPYSYSTLIMQPNPWNALLIYLKELTENKCEQQFTTALLNYYRNGQDSMGWHADNEKELGKNPVIASISLGAPRSFQLKHNTLLNEKHNILLENGSLLIMKGSTQHFWKHQIPKTQKQIGERINITFRTLL